VLQVNRNMNKYPPGKIAVICFLLLCGIPAMSQYGEDSVAVVEQSVDTVTSTNDYTTVTGEEEKTKFLKKDEYTGVPLSVKQRNVPDSLVKKLQEDDKFWYANTVFEKETPKEEKPQSKYIPLTKRTWFQTLVWFIIIGAFAAFLMIYLSSNNVGLFRRKNVTATAGEEDVITEDIFAINYQREIDKAASQGNYRLAVRLMFLRLLKNMSEKNIIRYQQDKTNLDYLMQLHGTSYYPNFFRITRNYEYSWYGKFDVSEEAYQLIRKDFDHFETGLR